MLEDGNQENPAKVQNSGEEILPGRLIDSFLNSGNHSKTTINDSTGNLSRPVPAGIHSHSWGNTDAENFDLLITSNRKFLLKEHHEVIYTGFSRGSERLESNRKTLLEAIENTINSKAELSRIFADMLRLERRQAKGEVTDEEVNETYRAVRMLLEVPDGRRNENRAKHIAGQVMAQAASPWTVNQGEHSTCVVAALESTAYSRHPGKAAQFVAELTLNGRGYTASGVTVSLSKKSLSPADSDAKAPIPADGKRSLASQIFQTAAAQLYFDSNSSSYLGADGIDHIAKAGQIRAEQQESSADDSGFRLLLGGFPLPDPENPDRPLSYPRLDGAQVMQIYSAITGESTRYLSHRSAVPRQSDGIETFDTDEELQALLTDMKDKHDFPVLVRVHTFNSPFSSEDGGWHLMTIRDYDPSNGHISLDNQWGQDSDLKGISVHDLNRAMKNPVRKEENKLSELLGFRNTNAVQDLENEVEWLKRHGHVSPGKELELARLKHLNEDLEEPDYLKELVGVTDRASGLPSAQRSRLAESLLNASALTSPASQLTLIEALHTRDFISRERFVFESVQLFAPLYATREDVASQASRAISSLFAGRSTAECSAIMLEIMESLPTQSKQLFARLPEVRQLLTN